MFSWKSGIDPVILILGTFREVVDAFVEIVGVRLIGVGGDVHHIPKFAIERYIYFAGFVNDNVGVTFCQNYWRRRVRERSHQRLAERLLSQRICLH